LDTDSVMRSSSAISPLGPDYTYAIVRGMSPDAHVDRLMGKLVKAVEVSLKATEAARAAVAEILKRGAETGIFFAKGRGAQPPTGFELTEQDRDFLRSLSIRPDRD
jgi:hypothetical protein